MSYLVCVAFETPYSIENKNLIMVEAADLNLNNYNEINKLMILNNSEYSQIASIAGY